MLRLLVAKSVTYARRVVVVIIGGTVLLVGIVMIVTPGPAFLVIPAGLAILAIEFAWARILLKRTRDYVAAQAARMTSKQPTPGAGPPANPAEDGRRNP